MKNLTRVALCALGMVAFASNAMAEEVSTGVTVNDVDVSKGSGSGWKYADGVLSLTNAQSYVLAGENTAGAVRVEVTANATVILNKLTLWTEELTNMVVFAEGASDAKLTLVGDNNICATNGFAAVGVVSGAKVTMDGAGALVGCKDAELYGRGVTVGSGGTFVMNGGTIRDYYARTEDKSLRMASAIWNRGTLTVNGGTFSGNKATEGSVICNQRFATANIYGGVFTDNEYNTLFINAGGTFTIYGCVADVTITDPMASGYACTQVGDNYIVGQGVAQEDAQLVGGTYTFDPAKAEYAAAGLEVAPDYRSVKDDTEPVTWYVEKIPVVAMIGMKEYTDLPKAFAEVKDGETITMVNNFTKLDITAATYMTLAAGKAVTFDLAGYSVYGETAIAGNTIMLQVNGDLTITDSSEGQTGYFGVKALYTSATAAYGNYLFNLAGGNVTLEGGTVENLSDGLACYVFQMSGSGSNNVTVNGGTARALAPVARMFPYNNVPTMTFTLNGGLLESTQSAGIQYFGYSVSCAAAITVTGGEIKAYNYGIYAYGTDGNMTIDVSDGKITTANPDYSAICLYNYRPALPKKTAVTISGGTISGAGYLMDVYDYNAATQTTISGGEFSGKFYVKTYNLSYPPYVSGECYYPWRTDDYCVRITGGNFTGFDVSGDSWFLDDSKSGVLLYGGTYDKTLPLTDKVRYKGRVAEGYIYLDNYNGTWTVVRGNVVEDVPCAKTDETTVETAEKPEETTDKAWETATNVVATATSAEAPAIVADSELTNAVEQAKADYGVDNVLKLWAEVNVVVTPTEAKADVDDNVIVIKTDVTPNLTTWAEVTDGETVTTNEVGDVGREFEYSGEYMAISFDVSEMTYEPILVIHRHDDETEERYTRGDEATLTTFAYDPVAKTITILMNSFSDVEIYAAVQVGETAYATIDKSGLCTVTGEGDMWSYEKPNKSVLWEHNGVIKTVVIEDAITGIGTNAFAYQKGVTGVTIGTGVTNVCEDAFFSCLNVANLAVGANVQTVGASAFGRCNSLTDLSFGSKEVAKECQGKAFKIVARITMNGSTPIIDAVPTVTIDGYTRTLYGAEALTDPMVWEKISDASNIPEKYHFFKYEYEEEM